MNNTLGYTIAGGIGYAHVELEVYIITTQTKWQMANGLRTATKLNVVMPPSLNGFGSSRYIYVYAGVMGDKMIH